MIIPVCIQGYSRKKYLGGEDGRQYIFLWVVGAESFQIVWVVGAESFQIIWVVGVRPNLITWGIVTHPVPEADIHQSQGSVSPNYMADPRYS